MFQLFMAAKLAEMGGKRGPAAGEKRLPSGVRHEKPLQDELDSGGRKGMAIECL